jgi:arsenate reductase (thioredoxin)
MDKKTVLFVCSFNSVRSPIAEGLLNARCGNRYTAFSAGIAPGGMNPYAIAVMKEIGIDISSHRSKKLDTFTGVRFDYVVTLCDHVKAAVYGSLPEGTIVLHHGFTSPSEIQQDKALILAGFRTLRDDIGSWLTVTFPDCPGRSTKNEA